MMNEYRGMESVGTGRDLSPQQNDDPSPIYGEIVSALCILFE